jgi:hypothetical protein
VCLNQVCVLTGTRKPRSTHIKSRVQTDLNSATSANPQKTPTIETIFNSFLVLLCYKLDTFVSITLALGSVMQYVEVDEPPPAECLASA